MRVPPGGSEPETILVVDDDNGIRALLGTSLRRAGYTVHEARNGREALEKMAAGGEDLVLLDLMMPEVSGWEVLAARRDDPMLRKIPVIVISANEARETAFAANFGICALLPKPFDIANLYSVVKSCLSRVAPCPVAL